MGAVGGMLGLSGGTQGTGIAGPAQANLVMPFTTQDIELSRDQSNTALAQQQGLLQALQQQGGLQNQSQVYNQLQGVANGTGPNPAQAQYQQNVQDLAKQQAGALASTKGISPALQARMIAQQGSAAGQNAAAAGATNMATQQLGAMGAAGNMANQQAGNQLNQTNANTASAQNMASMFQQSAANFNQGLTQGQSSMNSANAGMAGQQMQNQQKTIGGIANAAGSIFGLAGGGMVPSAGPRSRVGQAIAGGFAQGGVVRALVSPGETYLPPSAVSKVAQGANPLKAGEKIPGKPKVAGNSYANDVVPKDLKTGGIVIPNSVMQSKDPARGAAEFVRDVLAKKKVQR